MCCVYLNGCDSCSYSSRNVNVPPGDLNNLFKTALGRETNIRWKGPNHINALLYYTGASEQSKQWWGGVTFIPYQLGSWILIRINSPSNSCRTDGKWALAIVIGYDAFSQSELSSWHFPVLLHSDWLISEPHTTLTFSTTIYFWYRTKKNSMLESGFKFRTNESFK